MNKLHICASLAFSLLVLSACDSKSSGSAPASSAPAASPSANSVTPASSSPLPPAVPGSSPADGGTAIGGLSSTHQDDEGASKSKAPASTGGDGNGPSK
ncbi:hypothetical protein [uncultured Oxalicibacterium sp.]|uniref:hypothetical protein n=1 Tax=uncultured Oxalicibacterium sp. TaxID=1168540 RepID=UPI0025CC7297|nr:hypothetical protein [uncultured Oxalicibacterium sp.]